MRSGCAEKQAPQHRKNVVKYAAHPHVLVTNIARNYGSAQRITFLWTTKEVCRS
jgi:hypothetical protein